MSFDIKLTRLGFENTVEWRGLLSGSTCVLKAEPGKLDIIIQKSGILFISLKVDSLLKLAIMM